MVPDDEQKVFGELLAFYCPVEAAVSPHAEFLWEETLAWAEEVDLGQGDSARTHMLAATGTTLTAHMYPHASRDVAQAFARYNAWAWVPNLLIESGQSTALTLGALGRWQSIVRSPASYPQPAEPRDRALADAYGLLRDVLTPVQWERFTIAQRMWLYQMGWENALMETGAALSVNDYLTMRIGAAGGYAAAGYLDAAQGIELAEKQWARPSVRAAAEAGMLVGVLDNDRYSYLRERDLPDKKYNLMEAIRNDHPDHTFAQAVTEVVAIRDRIMTLYLRLREQLLTDAGPDLRRYLSGIDYCISGHIVFGVTAAHYLIPESPHTPTLTDTPATPTTEPLPYPAFTWWWDQLPPP